MAAGDREHRLTRSGAMADRSFSELFLVKRDYLRRLRVAIVTIDCPIELCLFEVYAAMKLGTGALNSFRTH